MLAESGASPVGNVDQRVVCMERDMGDKNLYEIDRRQKEIGTGAR